MHPALVIKMLEEVDLQIANRGVIAELASGAAFEGWLAFESRLCFEGLRSQLGLPASIWTANEFPCKIDLSIHDGNDLMAALEFKLVYNNKNWPAQVESIRNDLQPRAGTPKASAPPGARWAVVGLIGKLYQSGYGDGYAGPISDIPQWEQKVLGGLISPGGDIQKIWEGHRHALVHRWLDPYAPNFFQLHGLVLNTSRSGTSEARRS